MKALVTAAACGIVLLQTAFAAPDFAARAAATCTRQGAFGYRFGEQAAPGARVVSDWAGRRISVALGSEWTPLETADLYYAPDTGKLYRVHAWIALLDRAAPRERQAEPARRAVAAIEAKIAATRDFATKLVLGDHGTYRWNGLTFTVSRSWAVVHIECENEDYSPVAKGNGAQARIAPSLGPVTERPAPPAQDLPHRPSRALCATPESRKNLSAVLSENQQQVARYQAASALYYTRLGQWKAQKLAQAGWTPAQKRAFERNLAIDPVIAAKNQRIADLMSGYLRQATTKQKQGDAKSSCDMAFAGVDLAYESATTAVAVQRRMQELYDAEAHRLNVSFD